MSISKAELWNYSKGYYKVYLEEGSLAKKIAGWNDCQLCGHYYNRDGKLFGGDIIFPSKLYDRVAEMLGLPKRQKNPNRIRQGKKIAETFQKQRFLRDTKSKSASLGSELQQVDQ